MEQAVLREALEEAGVTGQVEHELGKWSYKSKSQDKMHDGFMFPLLVDQELDHWPEKDFRKRKWVRIIPSFLEHLLFLAFNAGKILSDPDF